MSLGIHAVLIGLVFLAPLVAAKESKPIEFVAVQIVPLQALGVSDPSPTPPKPAPKPAPQETPKVETVEPEVEEKPAAEPAVVAKPSPRSESSAQESTATQAAPPAAPTRREGSPLGSSLGTSNFGAAVGGLDNPDFVYSYYVDQMLAMIRSNWQRPALGGRIEATVHFRIETGGAITDLRIVESSGYNSFDLAGLRAVQLAAPFPPFPQSYRQPADSASRGRIVGSRSSSRPGRSGALTVSTRVSRGRPRGPAFGRDETSRGNT
ncbi:MAG: TonB family protein [Acidobacteriota bacterium]